jgi:hypothetical protein
MNLLGSQQQQVEVERPRAIADGARAIAPKGQFYPQQGIEQCACREASFQPNHGVDEARLILEPDRPGGVERGPACHRAEASELFDGSRQRFFRRSCRTGDVRSQSDVGELHASRLEDFGQSHHSRSQGGPPCIDQEHRNEMVA